MNKAKPDIGEITMDALRYIESIGTMEDNVTAHVFKVKDYLDSKYSKEIISSYIDEFIEKNINIDQEYKCNTLSVDVLNMSDTLLLGLALNKLINVTAITCINYEYEIINDEEEIKFFFINEDDNFETGQKLIQDNIRSMSITLGSYNSRLYLVLNVTYGRDLEGKSEIYSYGNEFLFSFDDKSEFVEIVIRYMTDFNLKSAYKD